MQYTFPAFRPSGHAPLQKHIDQAAGRLAQKLSSLSFDTVQVSNDSRTLLSGKLSNLRATLQVHTYLLTQALITTKRPAKETVLCDYGGGTGLFSFLAFEAGVKDVLYADIIDQKYHDALALALALGYQLNHAVVGDVADTVRYARHHGITPDAVCSFDVLEHIYDLDAYFKELVAIADGPLAFVMASNANPFNPFVRRRLMQWQRQAENEGFNGTPYPEIREQIILDCTASHNKEIPQHALEALVRATRGKHIHDIRNIVDSFLHNGAMPEPIAHPTNTCNPHTGSWLEHLFDHNALAERISSQGFSTRIEYGFYGASTSPLRAGAGWAVNTAIAHSGRLGRCIAPFFTLIAKRNEAKRQSAKSLEQTLPE